MDESKDAGWMGSEIQRQIQIRRNASNKQAPPSRISHTPTHRLNRLVSTGWALLVVTRWSVLWSFSHTTQIPAQRPASQPASPPPKKTFDCLTGETA